MKKGMSVMLYKDAERKVKDGMAKLLNKITERTVNGKTFETWEVRMIKTNNRVYRTILDDKN
jgi:helix-turn-helix protein